MVRHLHSVACRNPPVAKSVSKNVMISESGGKLEMGSVSVYEMGSVSAVSPRLAFVYMRWQSLGTCSDSLITGASGGVMIA